jgi:hypothetical protein
MPRELIHGSIVGFGHNIREYSYTDEEAVTPIKPQETKAELQKKLERIQGQIAEIDDEEEVKQLQQDILQAEKTLAKKSKAMSSKAQKSEAPAVEKKKKKEKHARRSQLRVKSPARPESKQDKRAWQEEQKREVREKRGRCSPSLGLAWKEWDRQHERGQEQAASVGAARYKAWDEARLWNFLEQAKREEEREKEASRRRSRERTRSGNQGKKRKLLQEKNQSQVAKERCQGGVLRYNSVHRELHTRQRKVIPEAVQPKAGQQRTQSQRQQQWDEEFEEKRSAMRDGRPESPARNLPRVDRSRWTGHVREDHPRWH